jgi:hypothetical protein
LQLLPFLPLLLVALLPAALLVTLGARLRRLSLRLPSRTRRASVSVAGWFLLALLALVAMRTGAELGYVILESRDEGQDPIARERPTLMHLDCKLGESPPSVEAVVWNKLDKPVVQQADNYSLVLADDLDDRANYDKSRFLTVVLAEDDPPATVVLGPGEVRRLRFLVPDYTSFDEDRGRQCGFFVADQTYAPDGSSDFPIKDHSIE